MSYITGGDAKTLTETTTSDYNKAVNKFVGKSAIPDFVGGFGFDIQIKNFNISTNFSYGLGGWGYDGVYAGLMSSGSVIGTRNWHKDIRNYWGSYQLLIRLISYTYIYYAYKYKNLRRGRTRPTCALGL